jgi:hypothetical protein
VTGREATHSTLNNVEVNVFGSIHMLPHSSLRCAVIVVYERDQLTGRTQLTNEFYFRGQYLFQ